MTAVAALFPPDPFLASLAAGHERFKLPQDVFIGSAQLRQAEHVGRLRGGCSGHALHFLGHGLAAGFAELVEGPQDGA